MCALLIKKLNKNNPNTHYTLINAGIAGSNPIYEEQIYHKLLSVYKHNLIIFFLYFCLYVFYTINNTKNIIISECMNAISLIFRIFYLLQFSFDNFNNNHVTKAILQSRTHVMQ
jgi:hypothetical protein